MINPYNTPNLVDFQAKQLASTAIWDIPFTPTEKLIYLYCIQHAVYDNAGEKGWISVPYSILAEKTGLSKSAAMRAVQRLLYHGKLFVYDRNIPGSTLPKNAPNMYYIDVKLLQFLAEQARKGTPL